MVLISVYRIQDPLGTKTSTATPRVLSDQLLHEPAIDEYLNTLFLHYTLLPSLN